MKNKVVIIPILISVLILAFSCKQPDMNVETTIEVPVDVIEVGISSLEEFINTTGTVYPIKEVSLNSEMTGNYRLFSAHPH